MYSRPANHGASGCTAILQRTLYLGLTGMIPSASGGRSQKSIDKSDKQSPSPTNPSPVSFGYSTYHAMAQNTRAGSDFSAGSPRPPMASAMGEYAFLTLALNSLLTSIHWQVPRARVVIDFSKPRASFPIHPMPSILCTTKGPQNSIGSW